MLTPKEVQEVFGISRDTLLTWERRGLISPKRTEGGHRRYDEVELVRVMAQERRNGGSKPVKPPFTELGSSGLRRAGGQVWEERLRELRGIQGRILLREMRENDPIIAAVFNAIENALRQVDWRVSPASERPEDREAAEFLESCLDDMSFTWNDTMQFILTMLEQGFSVMEIVYKRRFGPLADPASKYADGRIGWRKWAPRPAETIEEWVFDDAGGIRGVIQSLPDGRRVKIPIEKMLLFRTTVAPANSPEGRPIHRSMYIPWWYTQNLQEIEGIGVERDLAGIPVIYLGTDCTVSGPNSDFELAKELVVNLRNDEQVGVVIPKPKLGTAAPGEGMLLELLSTGGRRQHDTSKIIERYDKRKALAVLAQFIMLGMERVGSYALSQHQGDLFTMAISAWLESIAEVINRHAIPRLFRYNSFPGITGLPELKASPIGVPDLKAVADYVNRLSEAEVLTPDAELERHLRQLARLPERRTGPSVEEEEEERLRTGARMEEESIVLRRAILALRAAKDAGALSEDEFREVARKLSDKFLTSIGVELDEDMRQGPSGDTGL